EVCDLLGQVGICWWVKIAWLPAALNAVGQIQRAEVALHVLANGQLAQKAIQCLGREKPLSKQRISHPQLNFTHISGLCLQADGDPGGPAGALQALFHSNGALPSGNEPE
ncbi:MAG: hypothetical protein D6758_07155, partial [Gammaproteobacteria bacterium]